MAMLWSIVLFGLLLMLLLILLLLLLLVCRPWRFFSSYRSRTIKVGELDNPLVGDEEVLLLNESNELARNHDLERATFQNEALLRTPRTEGLIHKQRFVPACSNSIQGDSLVLDVISDIPEDFPLGQTLKRPAAAEHLIEVQKHAKHEDQSPSLKLPIENYKVQDFVPEVKEQRSCLALEVVSGPSCGLHYSVQSSASKLSVTVGRVPPSDLVLKDSEVSGKHALINWNSNKFKWELVDMGSLNGTMLNSKPINHPNSASRQWSSPVELASGDIITLGTTSNVSVNISCQNECQTPFGFGMASDPMSVRRGGKKLPMEDVCYYQWPLPGISQFGVFGICDGHGGAEAAKYASKILPETTATILSDSLRRERVLSRLDASDVLRDAFFQTEALMNHHYEGCTATVLLIWCDNDENFFLQCANVGDSACVVNVGSKQIKMTEDHRITSSSERQRIEEVGERLRDGETRICGKGKICVSKYYNSVVLVLSRKKLTPDFETITSHLSSVGLNLARMLGDKFMKQQDSRFSSEPYISPVVHIDQPSAAFALMASDGFWDVISIKKAVQLVSQMRERGAFEEGNWAEKVANFLLSEARTMRTKDNTSIIFLDFDCKDSSCKADT